MENEILKKESDKLADEFEYIIRNHPDREKSDISKMLMKRMRLETIYLIEDVVNRYRTSPYVTINPSEVKLEGELNDEEKNYEIRAYSFGPFNRHAYFKEDTLRILWLLKEPLMKSGDLDKYTSGKYKYLGGFDQAKQYSTWEKVLEEDNPTIKKLINYTQILLKEIQKEEKKQSPQSDFANEDLDNKNVVMNHICILEVNHFPGLAFNEENGNKSDDKRKEGSLIKWHELNEKLIQTLINFYDPKILIGGGTLEYYLSKKKFDMPNYKDVKEQLKAGKLRLFKDPIYFWSYVTMGETGQAIEIPHEEFPEVKEFVWKNVKYWGQRRMYIQANHPNAIKNALAAFDVEAYNSWREKSKENGSIKSPTE